MPPEQTRSDQGGEQGVAGQGGTAPSEPGGATHPEQGGVVPEEKPESTSRPAETTPTTEQATPTPATPPPHVFQEGWSTLGRDELVDKVKGIIYGQAIGDALGSDIQCDALCVNCLWCLFLIGLATEFMNKKEAAHYYGKDGPSHYSQIVHDFHRSRFHSPSVILSVW